MLPRLSTSRILPPRGVKLATWITIPSHGQFWTLYVHREPEEKV
jgi:hypothetical protein